MPFHSVRIRAQCRVIRQPKSFTMEAPIFVAVVELRPKPVADDSAQIFIECEISSVEDRMDVSSQ